MSYEVSSLRLPESMAKQLRSIAQVDGVDVAEILCVGIENHIAARLSEPGFKERLKKRTEEGREVSERPRDRGLAMRRRQQSLPIALGASIRNPLSRELLRRCVLAQRPVSLDELAASMERPRYQLRSHAEELEVLGALKVSEGLWPWRPAGHRYEASELLMDSQWALVGLGLIPGDRWLTDEERAEVDTHIAERRKDKEFMERLDRRLEEDLPVLEALAGKDEPLRLWRRARDWVRSRLLDRRPRP